MTDTPKHPGAPNKPAKGSRRRVFGLLSVTLIVICISMLRWGGYFLIASDPLPAHVDAAVVLQGSIAAENVRMAGAMRLLQQGTAGRVLLSVPKESYWGEPVAPVARHYLESHYGSEMARRVDFCQTGSEVNSTEDEAQVLSVCIREHGWPALAVVTSNYHTRRAGMIWRKVMREQDPATHIFMLAVADPEFEPQGWWHKRIYAKTGFLEYIKLVWTLLTG